ncbi:MAG: 50S ribosomal protein L17 [Phaeodactylibacter sp.]|nr:50S ribosomal protein L17 [Phaeodactylibacter sp.]MCB9294157.1 50S ribosomal protein L17 [Lewinellaceae bacterium]
MRHGKKLNHLGRKSAHRKALMRNLATALITHKRINTTLAKAKALRTYIEPLVTKSKDNTTHSRRVVFSYLQNKQAVHELFETVGPKVADRPGGYVRVIKTGFRRSDASEMAMIEFVDFNEVYTAGKSQGGGGRRRRRRGGGGGSQKAAAAATAATAATAAGAGEEEE